MMIRLSPFGDLGEGKPKRVDLDAVPLQRPLKVTTDIAWKYKNGDIAAGDTKALLAARNLELEKLQVETRQSDTGPRTQSTCAKRPVVDTTIETIEQMTSPRQSQRLARARLRRTSATFRVECHGLVSEG